MNGLAELKKHLKVGQVYRRSELSKWSKSIDRHLTELTEQGFLEKVFQGMYYVLKYSTFGKVPPNEDVLVRSFLGDNHFLLISPNIYNTLGVGTTQLYNTTVSLVIYPTTTISASASLNNVCAGQSTTITLGTIKMTTIKLVTYHPTDQAEKVKMIFTPLQV